MNLPETAFLCREGVAFELRWFTPKVEVDVCGQATLASAHFLWEEGHLDRGETARFLSKSGPLAADYRDGLIPRHRAPVLQGSWTSLPRRLSRRQHHRMALGVPSGRFL